KAETESAPAVTDKAAEGSAAKKHTVKKGDTLGKIARANRMTIDQLRKMNQIKPKDTIRPGQVLLVK
ncbi:MAG: LysM peptidoglycan-binding domain-containing protein, partial [Deltaproteobacteria bacterium]|nr:LysM peptidoglycan-binding domain-containing protein [Deltaproteobacteria bacterium]